MLLTIIIFVLIISHINGFFLNPLNRIRNTKSLQSEIVERKIDTPMPIDISHIDNMKSYQLQSINEYDFDEYINDKDITLCLFTSYWCGPCVTQEKTLITEIMPKHDNEDIHFIKIDTDNNVDLVNTLSIRSIPTTIIFKQGKIVSQIIGSVSSDVIHQHLSHINNDENFQ